MDGIIVAKGQDHEGILKRNGNVEVNGEETSIQKWLRTFRLSSIQTYVFAVKQEKHLLRLIEEYMERE